MKFMKKITLISVICVAMSFTFSFDSHLLYIQSKYLLSLYESVNEIEKKVLEINQKLAELEEQRAEIARQMKEKGVTETSIKRVVINA